MLEHVFFGPLIGLSCLFLLLLLTMAIGREKWATAACWLLLASALSLSTGGDLSTRVALAVGALLVIFVLQRFGLLAVASATTFYMTFRYFPITYSPQSWFLDVSVVGVLSVVAPAAYGAYLSQAGRPILGGNVLEERFSSSIGS